MVTGDVRTVGPGTFESNFSEMPSSGWMRMASTFGCIVTCVSLLNSGYDHGRKWIEMSVTRFGRRLPARKYNGTSAQRQLSMKNLIAAYVSTFEFAAALTSWPCAI